MGKISLSYEFTHPYGQHGFRGIIQNTIDYMHVCVHGEKMHS